MKLIFLLILFLGTESAVQDTDVSDCANQTSTYSDSDCVVDESVSLTATDSDSNSYNLGDFITNAINKISQFVQYGQLEQDSTENVTIATSTAEYEYNNNNESDEDVTSSIKQAESIELEASLCNITSIKATSGMLVSQVLRSSLAQCGYSMSYLAKYDCRLASSANIQRESYQEALASFLHSFSLSVKISTVNKMATVVAAHSSAQICTPLKYSLLIEGETL